MSEETVVQLRSVLTGAVMMVGVVALGQGPLGTLPAMAIAPAYDTATQLSLRNLALATTSYGLDGDLEQLTVADLADWGWTPGASTAVTLWVDGDDFRAVAQDVRAYAAQFEYTTAGPGGHGSTGVVVRSQVQPVQAPVEPRVTIIVGSVR